MKNIRQIINKIMPNWLSFLIGKFLTSNFAKFFYFREKKLIKETQLRYKKILEKLKNKSKYKVIFFVVQTSTWKYEELYNLMDKDEKFEPIIIVCPAIIFDKKQMIEKLETNYNIFKKKNHNVIKAFNVQTNEYLDVKKAIKPDIVFFTFPYNYSKEEYFITNYLDCLTCYVQYAFTITSFYQNAYDLLFHNLLWKHFLETPIHYEIAKTHGRIKAKNAIVTGYPGIDIFLDSTYVPEDVWKLKDKKLKRIIWAPHHTIDESKSQIGTSNFLKYNQFMIDIANKFSNKIQIAFKPHPLLKNQLYDHKDWGIKKADEYYKKWSELSNGQLEESCYIDLFLTSDAMIHDSGSFMAEYIAINKPVLFIMHNKNIKNIFNEFGKMAFEHHYHAKNEYDINFFVKNVVIMSDDNLIDKREKFRRNYILPNNNSASMNILNELVNNLT